MFQHFLITRFNVKHQEWLFTKKGDDVLSEKWLNNRFILFENYCLPSVSHQSNQNFTWLLFFDINTPKDFKDKIHIINKNHKNYIPIFLEESQLFYECIKDTISSLLNKETTHLVTTRLDNDDALHVNFMDAVKQNLYPDSKYIIDSRVGYQLSIYTRRIRKMNVAYNPFITLVESVTNFETVLSKKHHKWSSCQTVVLSEKPLWIQLIHDENITNREKIQYLETNKISFEDFAINPKLKLKSDVKIFISNGLSFLKRIWYKIK